MNNGYRFILCILFLVVGLNCKDNQPKEVKCSITFEKKMLVNMYIPYASLSIARIENYLLLYDSHFEQHKLVCIDYSTGKEMWRIENGIGNFYTYKNKIIVELFDSICAMEAGTGKIIWFIKNLFITEEYPLASELPEKALAWYENKFVIFHPKTQIIQSRRKGFIGANHLQIDGEQITRSFIGTENNYKFQGDLLSISIVEDNQHNRRDFIWSLDKEKREYYLTCLDSTYKVLNNYSWSMDEGKHLPEEFYDENTNPENLQHSVYLIDGQICFFESYINYRCGLYTGTNRLTCLDWQTGKLNYQKWGQSPKQKEFNTFLFFDQLILYGNQNMSITDEDGQYSRYNVKEGKLLDTLPQKVTLCKNYDKDHLLSFTYKAKKINEEKYQYSLEMKLWNRHSNHFSKSFNFDFAENSPWEPFVFPKDGLIITYYYYLNESKHILLNFYRLKQ
jgi:outer membrane protein assembly factor BamB